MTHSELELQLDAYLDGELASSDARELETHLKECRDAPGCGIPGSPWVRRSGPRSPPCTRRRS